jgi:YHS domain-containing protein
MKKLVLVLLAMLVSICIYAQSSTLRKKHLNQTNQVAIEGYDPVAYFTQHRAIKGSKTISHTALGVTYYFSSQENKKLFIRNRDKYEPQYGGWCASAMSSNGQKVKVDPTNFKIIDSKLYLFCDTSYKNSLSGWKKDEKSVILKGDKNWGEQYK